MFDKGMAPNLLEELDFIAETKGVILYLFGILIIADKKCKSNNIQA